VDLYVAALAWVGVVVVSTPYDLGRVRYAGSLSQFGRPVIIASTCFDFVVCDGRRRHALQQAMASLATLWRFG
jgi:hypothetical protein